MDGSIGSARNSARKNTLPDYPLLKSTLRQITGCLGNSLKIFLHKLCRDSN